MKLLHTHRCEGQTYFMPEQIHLVSGREMSFWVLNFLRSHKETVTCVATNWMGKQAQIHVFMLFSSLEHWHACQGRKIDVLFVAEKGSWQTFLPCCSQIFVPTIQKHWSQNIWSIFAMITLGKESISAAARVRFSEIRVHLPQDNRFFRTEESWVEHKSGLTCIYEKKTRRSSSL